MLPQAWSRWLLAVPVTASESSTFLWRLPSAALLQPPTLPNYNTAGVEAESASSVADRIVAEVMAPWRSTNNNSSSRHHAIELANVIAAPARRRECVLIHIDATRQVAVHYGPNRRHILTSAVYSQRLAFFVQLLQLTMEAAASAHGTDNSAATPSLQLPQVFSFCAGDCVTSQTSHRHDYMLVPDTANTSTTTQPTWWRRWAAAAARTCSSTDSSASTLPLATLGVVACQGSASLPVPVAMRGGPPAQWDNVTTAFARTSKEAAPPWNERPRVAVFRGAARSTLVRPWTCGNTGCDSSVQASNSTWRWGGRTRVLVQAAKLAPSAATAASAGERVGDSLDLGFSPGGQGGPGLIAAMQQASGITLHGGASMVEQQGRGRYTLDLAGHCGWADRLALLLFGSAAVIRQETPCAEWYVLGLQPWRHYAPVDYLLDSLPTTLAWLQRHDKEAQAMVQAAQTYARTVLSLQGQMTYLSRLMRAYTAATLFTAEKALQEAQVLYGEHWHWVKCGSEVQRHDETVAPVDLAVVGDVCGEDWSLRTWLQ